jgi:F-type H+-transporting ATPase subunit b
MLLAGGAGEWVPTIAKVVNLILFVAVLYFLLRRPIGNAFRAKQEGIKRDLVRAREERDMALAKLAEVESRLENLNSEVEALKEQGKAEAEEERVRIEQATDLELTKLREQARREIEGAGKVARASLREYAAEETVKLAEEMIRRELRPQDDSRLVAEYVEELGGIGR